MDFSVNKYLSGKSLNIRTGDASMEFSYGGKIEKLSEFYKSMRKLNVQIGTFEHSYNKITSDVIFDTRDTEQWNLLFIKRGTGETLSIPLNKGFYLP